MLHEYPLCLCPFISQDGLEAERKLQQFLAVGEQAARLVAIAVVPVRLDSAGESELDSEEFSESPQLLLPEDDHRSGE